MVKLIKWSRITALSLSLGFVVYGCAAMGHSYIATILPRNDGAYDMVATDAREDGAYKIANDDGKAYCKEHGDKKFVVIEHKSAYQGVAKDEKQKVGASDVAFAFVTKRTTKGDRSDDYKVNMMFKCE